MKTTCPPEITKKLAQNIILDELFALLLYRRWYAKSSPELKGVLLELIAIEEKHYAFWQKFLGYSIGRLNLLRQIKLKTFAVLSGIFGEGAIHLFLEAIEINGVRKYLRVWSICSGTEYEKTVRTVLEDELEREDIIVLRLVVRKVNPQHIRNIFLGFNDGLVELLGAVSGFYAAFDTSTSVLIASVTVAVAGAISMGAGAYVALSSQNEVAKLEAEKKAFIHRSHTVVKEREHLFLSGATVAISYLVGAFVPLVPVFFGSKSIILSLFCGGIMIALVSAVLAFLSGMDVKRRIATNVVIIIGAVIISYAIGLFARNTWGIAI